MTYCWWSVYRTHYICWTRPVACC